MNETQHPNDPIAKEFSLIFNGQSHMVQILLEAISIGMCLVNDQGIITYWNAAAEQLTGLSRKQAVGRMGNEVFNCPNEEQHCPLIQKRTGSMEPLSVEIVMNNKGRSMHLRKDVHFIHAPDGTISGAIESFIDLTSQIEAETALNEARELTTSAREAKRHFMANMSHEVRTPLNGIIGLLDLLLNDHPTPTQSQNLLDAKRLALLLLDLADNILGFSVADKGTVEIEHTGFSLSSIINSVIARQYDLKQNWSLVVHSDIDSDVPDNLVGDSGRLYHILKQLVNNAIKFTPNGEVAIGVMRVPSGQDSSQDDSRRIMLHFTIKDTGVGIPEAQLDAIFEAMSQADSSSTRTFGGLGIGLARVHHLVNLLEGRIWIESKYNLGTTVHLLLPFKDATAAEDGHAEPSSIPIKIGTVVGAGHLRQHFELSKRPLTAQWKTRFDHLETLLFTHAGEAEELIDHLKTQAKAANQKSVEKLLFRLLLAIRRNNEDDIHNYYYLLAHKITSGDDAYTMLSPEGERHENIDR